MKIAYYFFILFTITATDIQFIYGGETMYENQFLPAKKLTSIAVDNWKASGLPYGSGMGESSLIPLKSGFQLQVVIFFHRCWANYGIFTLFPPDHIMKINPVSGKVIQFGKCKHQDFGLKDAADKPLSQTDIRSDPDPNVKVWKMEDRLNDISPVIWGLYDKGKVISDPKTRGLIREYHSLFSKLGPPALKPYYKAISPDFFAWLEKHIR